MKLVALSVAVILLASALASVWVVAFIASAVGGDPKPSISERINTACPAGYKVTNWETDGEFTDIPADTIKVTCVSKDDVKYVAVNR